MGLNFLVSVHRFGIYFIIFLALVFGFSELQAADSERSSGLSRRGFLRGFFASAAVVAVNPMAAITTASNSGLAEGLSAGLPEALKRKLVQLRLRSIYTVGSETAASPDPFLGLKNYIKILEDLVHQTTNPEHKALLMKKVAAAQEALLAYQNAFFRGLSTQPSSNPKSETTNPKASHEDADITSDESNSVNPSEDILRNELNQKPLDIRVLTIRGLLGPDLLRRMAWQVHFVNYKQNEITITLRPSDMTLILQYYGYLHEAFIELQKQNLFLASKSMLDTEVSDVMTASLLIQFMDEAREVILSYEKAANSDFNTVNEMDVLTSSCMSYLR